MMKLKRTDMVNLVLTAGAILFFCDFFWFVISNTHLTLGQVMAENGTPGYYACYLDREH